MRVGGVFQGPVVGCLWVIRVGLLQVLICGMCGVCGLHDRCGCGEDCGAAVSWDFVLAVASGLVWGAVCLEVPAPRSGEFS